MDPVTLIVTALAAGVALALKDTAPSAVRDAYGTLRTLARRHLAGRPGGELVLDRYEREPAKWRALLEAELTASAAYSDADLLAAAQTLMTLADEAGSRAGKYSVDMHGSQGVHIGDHNVQNNTFNESRPAEGLDGLGGDQRGD